MRQKRENKDVVYLSWLPSDKYKKGKKLARAYMNLTGP
jgi:hypothetical protein